VRAEAAAAFISPGLETEADRNPSVGSVGRSVRSATMPGYSQADFDTAADLMETVQGNLDQGYCPKPKPESRTPRCLKCISDPRGHATHRNIRLPGVVPKLSETPGTVVVLQDSWQHLTTSVTDQMGLWSCCMARKPARETGGGDSWAQ
jgi:hypothetical protein